MGAKHIRKNNFEKIYSLNDNKVDYCDYFVTYRQVVLGLLEMPNSQKPKDVLHTTDVPSKNLTFLNQNLGQKNKTNCTQSFQTSIHK